MSSKREKISPDGDDRLVRRDDKGRFKAQATVKPGQGDKGDQKRR